MGTIPAVVVHTNGVVEVVNLDNGYKAIQAVVGGYFEMVSSASGDTSFWVHEEGKLIGLEPNIVATKILWALNPAFDHRELLLGPVLLTGGVDDEGETLGVGVEGLNAVHIAAK
jgi:hypothetical protein